MSVYISLLRAVNVSGKNVIKMSLLKELYEKIGFNSVKTYIQSGNVVFQADDTDIVHVHKQIKQGILADFGLDIAVIILTQTQLEQIIQANILQDMGAINELYVTYLDKVPQDIPLSDIKCKMTDGETIEIMPNVAYIHVPNGYGKTKLTNTFLEKKLNVLATTRNWNTTNKLLQLAQTIK